MRRSRISGFTALAAALALAASGCDVVDDEPRSPDTSRARSKAVAQCAGAECEVRVTCKGRVLRRVGPAPVDVRTSKTALTTTVLADFAGSRHDARIRC